MTSISQKYKARLDKFQLWWQAAFAIWAVCLIGWIVTFLLNAELLNIFFLAGQLTALFVMLVVIFQNHRILDEWQRELFKELKGLRSNN